MYQHNSDLTLDAAFRLLASSERRAVLRRLRDATGSVTIGDLADGALEESESNPDTWARNRVRLELYHLHLPRLQDTGLIEFNAETGEVRYQPDERVERLLRTASEL